MLHSRCDVLGRVWRCEYLPGGIVCKCVSRQPRQQVLEKAHVACRKLWMWFEKTLCPNCSNGGFVKLVYRPLRLLIWILFRSHPHALSFHQSTPAHVALTYPAMALTPLFILTGCFSWPLDLSGSTLQPSGPPPPPPPGSYLHPSDAPDGLLSAQTVHRITLLSRHSTGPWLRLKMFPEPAAHFKVFSLNLSADAGGTFSARLSFIARLPLSELAVLVPQPGFDTWRPDGLLGRIWVSVGSLR